MTNVKSISKTKQTLRHCALFLTISATSLLLGGCDSKTETIVDGITDAENLFFTPDGRLFVSGNEDVFEVIQKSDGSYDKLDTFHSECLVEGITQRGDYIYGVCTKTTGEDLLKSYLLAGEITPLDVSQIDPAQPNRHPGIEMKVIGDLPNILIPNGLIADDEGHLYIADYGSPKISKVTLNSPTKIKNVNVWKRKVGTIVNGLKWVDDHLYFSAQLGNSTAGMGRIQKLPNGRAGEIEVLFERKNTIVDDILPYNGGMLITDFIKGSVIFWKDGVVVAETEKDYFFAPSALVQAQAPMFDPSAILATEKGIIGDADLEKGNKVGLFLPEF